jgi:predicted dinucleotide-binding enzyme
MRVGILGRGGVGTALAEGFESRGHEVRIGGRDEMADIATWAELNVLAVLGAAAVEAVGRAGSGLDGKTLIDATNPLEFHDGGPPTLFVGTTDSLGEQVQRAAPAAHVVKCFNTITAGAMVDPSFGEGRATMFVAGDDDGAKAQVAEILRSFGWSSIEDLGGIEASRVLEPLCLAWVIIGVRHGAWDHALSVVR